MHIVPMISLHNFRGCARPPGRAVHPAYGRQHAAAPLPTHRREQKRQHLPRSVNSASGAFEDEQEQPAEGAETAEGQGAADLAAALSASDAQRPDAAADATAEVSFVTALRQRTRRLQALDAYSDQMQRRDEEIDVLECALLIAKHAHPDLDGSACRREIESLACGVRETLPHDPVPLRVVQAINNHLYSVHGFRGNEQDFYNTDNSCLNKVLENRTGIPITMALVYTNIASRVGLPMIGINLPGHFMLSPAAEDVEVLVDPFHGGEVCFLEDAADKLARVHGLKPGKIVINPAVVRNKSANAVTPRKFLARMLHNLKQIYQAKEQPEGMLAIIQYLKFTTPDSPAELRDEGLCLYALERYSEAAESLEQYLQQSTWGPDHKQLRSLLERMRRRQDPDAPEDTPSRSPGL